MSDNGMHIHVGSNTPGYLSEADPMCFDSIDEALEALKHEVKDQQDYYWELCESIGEYDFGSCECEWCDAASDCEAIIGRIADRDAAYVLRKGWDLLYTVHPDHDPSISHWANHIRGTYDDCELNED